MNIELSPSVLNSEGFIFTDGGRSAAGFNERMDCTVRAFAILSDRGYSEAHKACATAGRKNRRRFYVANAVHGIASTLNLELTLVKRSGTVGKLISEFPQQTLMVHVSGHLFAVKNGTVYDTFHPSHRCRVKRAWAVRTLTEVSK